MRRLSDSHVSHVSCVLEMDDRDWGCLGVYDEMMTLTRLTRWEDVNADLSV